MHDFLGDVDGFLAELFSSLTSQGIDVSRYELDHICYRVESQDEYVAMKAKLSGVGVCLGEHLIGGRPIATYKQRNPIVFQDRKIFCVELPSPKASSPHVSGLEHAEFVIDLSFEEFIARHPRSKFDIRGIGKKHHPQIELKTGRFSVKFHHMSLEKVIEFESRI